MSNYDKLVNAGLILSNCPPNATDVATINGLNSTEVDGLIDIYQTVGASFLERNCNVSSPGPGQNVRTIGIVF